MEPRGGYREGTLEPSLYPLTGFVPERSIWPLGQIELLMTFGSQDNHRTDRVHFDVVDLESSFNAVIW